MNENFTYNMDELLVKYLLREASDEERQMVEQWVQSGEANRRQLQHFTLLWQESKKLESQTVADEEDAWKRFRQKIHPVLTTEPLQVVKKNNRWVMRAAAVALLIIGASVVYFLVRNNPAPQNQLVQVQSADSSLAQHLPDGTVVTLNRQSSIVYPQKFTSSSREVVLSGEAFFNVSPDKSKPFIITVNDIRVKVVGTSFNIRSRKGRTEVIVETGVVEVMRNQEKLVLKAAEKVVIADSAAQLVKETSPNRLYQHYRTGEFVCDNTPLWQLVEVLNQTYSVNIVIGDSSLKKLPLTATYYQESLDGVLDLVSKTLDITVVKKNDTIILRK